MNEYWFPAVPDIVSADVLAAEFASPPPSARPRVWWHWMNGNITTEGIRKDLEWMKRVGVGGLQNFDGALDTPQVVDRRLIYMSAEWRDAFRYAAELAEQLGLELAVASSPGWSETGGPWVEPKDGMKKLVWSAVRLEGGRSFKSQLPAPPAVAGPFQDIPAYDVLTQKEHAGPRFYEDVAVVAYRTPQALLQDPEPVNVTTSDPSADTALLLDGDIKKPIALPVAADEPAWVLYDYGQPQRFRAASVARSPKTYLYSSNSWLLEASDDGKCFRRVAELPADSRFVHHVTIAFPAVTARFLRLSISPAPANEWLELYANAPCAEHSPLFGEPVDQIRLSELRFHAGARVHRFEDKAGFSIASDYYAIDSSPSSPDEAVDPKDIVDLTAQVRANGALEWNPPVGNWTVLRLGYSLTGKTNHPASPEATGLEVDKLDQRAVKAYLDTYLGQFEQTLGPSLIGRRGLKAFLTDSIESAGQNWTAAMPAEFKARRGYDLVPWLPAFTGVIVGDAARTDRFLWDFRRTLMELISDAHYRQIAASAHERGLIYYSESLEGCPTFTLGDDLDMRQHADIPMAAAWTNYRTQERDGITNLIADMRGAASVAHVFGRNLVAVESLTSCGEPWVFSPASLRPVIDLTFALGMNRPVIHTSVHQPIEKKPGVTLGPCGQHFTRHESWGELAGPWITYLSRSAYLLQQGRPVADVAWFYGEEGALASLYTEAPPGDLPEGHGFDFVNANMLLHHLSARDGRLISTGGASYRALYLGGSSIRMTLSVLRRLKTLSDEGVPIAGRRPIGSPSLADEAHEAEYRRLVSELWDGGRICDCADPNAMLARLGIPRDFEFSASRRDSSVMFVHRELADGEIYFVTNRKARAEHIEARFRVTGRTPELWHADTGERDAASWRIEQHHTVVLLDLHAHQSVFVIFREPTQKTAATVHTPEERPIIRLDGDWQLTFEAGRGAPEQALSTALGSWINSAEPGIKYFSGIGTYRTSFTLRSTDIEQAGRIMLDLGQVHEMAEVILNNRCIGVAWHAPFRLDVTHAIRAGANTLEIRVANLWVNRLIGDKQPGATPIAFTVTSTYRPDAPLRPSGLLGPVTLLGRAP